MWKKGWKRKHDTSGGAGGSDEDRHGGAGGSKKPAGSRSDSNDDNDITVCEIAKNRRVSVRSWQGKIVVDIREFYMKDGKQLPGKKGISLPMDQWKILCAHIEEIDKAVKENI